MKDVKVIVPFYVNRLNMKQILGKNIENYDELPSIIFKNISSSKGFYPIYAARQHGECHESEYADSSDLIVASVVRYIKDKNAPKLEISYWDALYCCKLSNPVIKVNGYFTETENGDIHLDEITRLTLASL